REHIQNLANTKIGDRYMFSGTKTTTAPFDGENYVDEPAFTKPIEIEVFSGIMLPINSTPIDVFKDIDKMFEDISAAIEGGATGSELAEHISTIDKNMNKLLEPRAGIGALQNRVELMDTRLQSQEIIATKRMSEN